MSRTLGALLFDGFELLDLYGPLEMAGLAGWRIRLLSLSDAPVASAQGPRALPDGPASGRFDVVLVPGGPGVRRAIDDEALLAALVRLAAEAGVLATVCTGAALAARAGLLSGRRATTNRRAFDWVAGHGADVAWERNARWVADGAVWTSAGVSAGIDMSLALIARLDGPEAAAESAGRAEYRWDPTGEKR